MITTNPSERSRLIEAKLLELKDKEFEWGVYDCYLFSNIVQMEYTEQDHSSEFRGKYTTEMGAAKIIAQHGGPVSFVSLILDQLPQASLAAHVGDVVAYKVTETKFAMGICIGAKAVFLSQDGKFTYKYLVDCICSWRIA